MANEVRIRATVNDQVSGQLDKMRDRFDTLGKSKGFQSIVAGVGLGIGQQIWQQATGSIVGFIGDAISAAQEEEVSIQKLTTALRANVPAWDGQTDAIERTLTARMKLGFSDDEQRDSLAKLVAATHDVNKALEIQRTAMDLARFKGISLADATDALTKVEAGSYRILKSLGISLKDGATQTEALAAVQKVAAGQAEDYANTNEGKLLVSQVKVNEAMEKFGKVALPAVAEGTSAAADAISGLAGVLDVYQSGLGKTTDAQKDQIASAGDLFSALGILSPAFGAVGQAAKDMGEKAEPAMTGLAENTGKAADDIVASFDDIKEGSGDLRKSTVYDAEKVAQAWKDTEKDIADVAQGMIDDFFDPIETRSDAWDAHQAVIAANESRRKAKTKLEARKAADAVTEALDDEATALAKLSAKGKLTAKDVDTFEADVKKSYKAIGRTVPPELQKIIDRLRIIAGFKSVAINVRVGLNQGQMGNGGARALGGPVDPNKVYLVGEQGPELFVSKDAGTIVPNGAVRSGRGASSGAGGSTFVFAPNVSLGAGLSAGAARQFVQDVGPALYADMQRKGFLPRSTGLRG